MTFSSLLRFITYRIYSINRPGRLLNFWTLRVGANSRLGAYSNKYGTLQECGDRRTEAFILFSHFCVAASKNGCKGDTIYLFSRGKYLKIRLAPKIAVA